MLILPIDVVDDLLTKLFETSPFFSSNMNVSPTKRFRRAVGTLDDDSDEDPEIDLSATSTPCGIRITHHTFPSKRQKMKPADEQVAKSSPGVMSNIEPEATADDQTPGEANPVKEKKRKQVRVSCYFEVAG
jgi:hypothetical protein